MSYKKHGGLHFVRIGRFGFSFFWSAKPRTPRTLTPNQIIDAGIAQIVSSNFAR